MKVKFELIHRVTFSCVLFRNKFIMKITQLNKTVERELVRGRLFLFPF
jgi:hypothetical protein